MRLAYFGTAVCGFAASLAVACTPDALAGDPLVLFAENAVCDVPGSLLSIDFDGDNIVDLVTVCSGSSNVAFLKGQGDGRFALAQTTSVGKTPRSAAAGDLDSDGLPDLLVANTGENSLSFLRNLGGQLSPAKTFALSGVPNALALSDVDGDGALDAAIALGSPGLPRVALFRGDGDGGLSPFWEGPTSVTAGCLVAADVNADGAVDLLAAGDPLLRSSGNHLVVRLGQGDGSFGAEQLSPVSSRAAAVPNTNFTVADLNGDGIPDVAVMLGSDGAGIGILIGKGNGLFEARATYDLPSHSGAIAVADLDGDGTQDLLTSDQSAQSLAIWKGDGGGGFAQLGRIAVPWLIFSLAASDFDRDGKTDVAAANFVENKIVVLLNTLP